MDDLGDVSFDFQLQLRSEERRYKNVLPTATDAFSTLSDILVKCSKEVRVMGPNYRWGPEKTIELLNVVQRWEMEIKEGQPKGSRKWQWVAVQLFVPDEGCDLQKLSKRCERRVALLRANYESYFYQRMLMEEGLPQAPLSPIRMNAALWEKMMEFFGEPKIISKRLQVGMPAVLVAPPLVASVRKSHNLKENKVDDQDDQGSEDEPARAPDHGEPEESSSSSVGSNNSYQGSAPVFLPASSACSSYYDISSSDRYAQSSEGQSKTTARTLNNSSQSCGSSVNYSSEADISVSKTVAESSSHDESSISLGSYNFGTATDRSHNILDGQTPAAIGSATGIASFSSPVEQTVISQATDHRTLNEDLNSFIPSCVSHSAAAAIAASRLPLGGGSDHSSPSKSSESSSTEFKGGSVCYSLSKYCDAFCSCEGFSSGEKSPGQATSTGDRKNNSLSSDPSRLGGIGSTFAAGEIKDKTAVMAAAAGEARYGGPSERGGVSSPKTPGAGMVFYDSNQRDYVRQLPASFAGLSLSHPPSPAAGSGDGDDQCELINELAKFMCDDMCYPSSKPSSKEHPHAQESGSQSSKQSSKEHLRAQESGRAPESGNRRSFSSSYKRRDRSSSPEPSNSSSSSILDTSAKDDNVNLMVYIQLNNLKLSEPS